MNKDELKSAILEYIESHKGTTFTEIEWVFEENNFDYEGNLAYTSGENPNIVFWVDWNKEAFTIIDELKRDGFIEMSPCPLIVYLIDGKLPTLPVAKSKYIKTNHWLPATFNICKKDTEHV